MSKRSRQAQDVLRQVRKDEIGRDRRHQVQARLAEFSLDVVLGGEAEAAVGLQAHVRRLPGRLRGEVFGHVRLRAAVEFLVKKRSGRSEEHTSELQSPCNLVCRLLLEKKKKQYNTTPRQEF